MLNDELKKRKKELHLTTEELSTLSGVPVGTINKILNGSTKSPRISTLESLQRVLYSDSQSDESDGFCPDPSAVNSNQVHESSSVYAGHTERLYTVEEYLSLPEDVRAELIDGHLVYMATPSVIHQKLCMELSFEFSNYIRSHKGNCTVLCSPLDVQLEEEEDTIVQPDIIIFCDPSKDKGSRIIGAPDLCVEIVSPSSASRDYLIKAAKYAGAGVREYWIVDPAREKTSCYFFENAPFPAEYTFRDKIPVKIYEGFEVDFEKISSESIFDY